MLNDALYLNPSYAAFLPTYSGSANYGWHNGTSDQSHHGNLVNVSLQDGSSDVFQAGVGYTRRDDVHIFHVGAAKSVNNQYGFGIGGKFIITRDDAAQQAEDATASFTLIASSWLQAVMVVDNLIESDFEKAHNFYREFIIGTKFNILSQVLIYFDPHLVPDLGSSYGHELGLELTPFTDVFFRLGQFTNAKSPSANVYGNGFGVGIGWMFPRLSIDYGMARLLTPVGVVSHTFGATIFL